MRTTTPFFSELQRRIDALGGLFNAHLHLDRAGTWHETRRILAAQSTTLDSALSIPAKHSLIPLIHASNEFVPERLEERVSEFLEMMVNVGTTRADTVVDTTDDRVGLHGIESFERLRVLFRGRLDLRVGAYTPLGLRDDEPRRWELLLEGARRADFLGSLPERDDHRRAPDHIGFDEHCRRILSLGMELCKPMHIHADQMNHPEENGVERILRVAEELGIRRNSTAEPWIWLVHAISPSTYPEPRFEALLAKMLDCNIGVICCPSAAISMRQCRPVMTPTFNSIARVLEMSVAGIHVRVGSDNICDITSPAGTPDLMDELFVLCNAIRYYDVEFLAKLGAGVALEDADRDRLRRHLDADRSEVAQMVNLV